MIWDEIEFIFRETALQLRRERLIAIATISTVAVLLILLGAIVLFHLNLRLWTGAISNSLEIRAYFDKELSRMKAVTISDQVAQWPEVEEAKFVTKEEGLKWLRANFPNASTMRGLGNPFSDGIKVKVRDPRAAPSVAKKLKALAGVRNVVPSPDDTFVQRVIKVRDIINWAGLVVAFLVAIAGIFIVHNTVRLALHSRWREIYIMQLVGATRSLVAAPFLLEGLFHGLVGSAIACCLLIPAHMYLRDLTVRVAPFFLLMPDRDLVKFGLCLLAAGAFLGFTGSAVSLRRFLRRRPGWQS